MKRFFVILIALSPVCSAFGQEHESSVFHKRSLLLGFGIGTKSHIGNWGLTSNYFVSRNVSIKLSAGGGQFNYNGFLLSVGPEYCKQITENKLLLLGSTWTVSSGTSDVIDDESPTRREFEIRSNQYIRTYAGIAFVSEGSVFRFEIGYSQVLFAPRYTFYDVWTADQIEQIKRAMGSGLLVSISAQGVFH